MIYSKAGVDTAGRLVAKVAGFEMQAVAAQPPVAAQPVATKPAPAREPTP